MSKSETNLITGMMEDWNAGRMENWNSGTMES
jgi:hypothetical protein